MFSLKSHWKHHLFAFFHPAAKWKKRKDQEKVQRGNWFAFYKQFFVVRYLTSGFRVSGSNW